jgi:glycosyltransferase involved in cell wall biosynthesis
MSTDCKLLIVGEDVVGGPALRQLATDLRLEKKVVFMPRVNSEHLRTLYCGATLTVLPSFEEGFGLTVLESMACGTPVACSRRASMPEVGGEAVQYFDPGSDDSIAQAMQTVLSSGTRRRDLRELGLLQARQYRWSSSAQEHLRLYWKYLYRDFPLRGRPAESAFHNTAP